MSEFKLLNVGIAEMAVSSSPNILRTILGSCVGICMYDSANKIGGLSHIMLPELKSETSSVKKYANTAIPLLIDELEKAGAVKQSLRAKIVGGSTMFKLAENSVMSEIGKGNIAKTREVLEAHKIKIISEDVGGDYGRTVDFLLESGDVKIKSLGKSEKII